MVQIKVEGKIIEFTHKSKRALCDWCGKKYKWKNLYSILLDDINTDGTTTYISACICDKCNLKHDVV